MKFVDNLFLAATKFEKAAGLFEGPGEVYLYIKDWCVNRYIEQVLYNLHYKISEIEKKINNTPEDAESYSYELSSMRELIRWLDSLGFRRLSSPRASISTKYPLSKIINWKYVADEKDTIIEKLKSLGWKDDIGFRLIFEPKLRQKYISGDFDTESKVIRIVVNTEVSNKNEFAEELRHIQDTVKHEVTHLGQSILNDVKNIQQSGIPFKQNKSPKEIDYHNNHSNFDCEFYPVLGDSISEFNRYKFDTKKEQEDYFKLWVGLVDDEAHSFFKDIRDRNPDKWRKAIKEMYKNIKWKKEEKPDDKKS